MTIPTTNLLAWIDERVRQLLLDSRETEKIELSFIAIRISELELMKIQVLQEVDNEKAVIEDAYINGTFFVSNNSMTTRRQKRRRATEYYLSIQTTFNPNNDERK